MYTNHKMCFNLDMKPGFELMGVGGGGLKSILIPFFGLMIILNLITRNSALMSYPSISR